MKNKIIKTLRKKSLSDLQVIYEYCKQKGKPNVDWKYRSFIVEKVIDEKLYDIFIK